MSSLLTNVAKITEENDVDISVKFTFCEGKGDKDNGKSFVKISLTAYVIVEFVVALVY